MLQVIFGDDEHTAEDGAYKRCLAARKWLYVTTSALLIVNFGLYDASAFKALISLFSLPEVVLKRSLLVASIYLILQYSLIVAQLITTYDLILNERFKLRKFDEMDAARKRLTAARDSYANNKEKFAGNEKIAVERRSSARALYLSDLENSSGATVAGIQGELDNLSGHDQETRLRYAQLRNKSRLALEARRFDERYADEYNSYIEQYDAELENSRSEVAQAEQLIFSLLQDEPSERRGYKITERLFDLFRISPPYFLVAYSWWSY